MSRYPVPVFPTQPGVVSIVFYSEDAAGVFQRTTKLQLHGHSWPAPSTCLLPLFTRQGAAVASAAIEQHSIALTMVPQ